MLLCKTNSVPNRNKIELLHLPCLAKRKSCSCAFHFGKSSKSSRVSDWKLCLLGHLEESLSLTATEFFMSATAEVNSLKCSSGQKTRGWARSPLLRPARTQATSHCSLLVITAAWYFPVEIPYIRNTDNLKDVRVKMWVDVLLTFTWAPVSVAISKMISADRSLEA